jgi:predicted esterase
VKNVFWMGLGVALSCAACGGGETSRASDSSTAATSGSGGAGGGAASGTGGSAVPQPIVPPVTGTCPEFVEGSVTFAAAGIAPRSVQMWIGPEAATQSGPLVFYWHGNGSNPNEAPYGIGDAQVAAIKSQGGIIVAPTSDPGSGNFDWHLTAGMGKDDDLILADEIVACAIEKAGIDVRRIHTMGMSAGALQSSQMAYRRSNYIASVVPYSGGKLGDPPIQDESNKFAAMIFHGGPGDEVLINFNTVSEALLGDLRGRGHFAFICDHGNGHKVPIDAGAAVWQFLSDHRFGTAPSPYEGALPGGFPSYCSL